ncbi:Unconventional myosin heavy chain 6 [Lucilia cuprina]|nr:Unconventional myosin heavy chain 6 [Lucilia cuprina]
MIFCSVHNLLKPYSKNHPDRSIPFTLYCRRFDGGYMRFGTAEYNTLTLKELCKYMRGEFNAERELQAIQYIIGLGIEREELRDEIFVQCIRQTTKNPNLEWTDRLWLLLCLIIVAFQPSKLLFRYFVSHLKKCLETLDGKLRQYAQWCFDNCKCTKVSSRLLPPSSVEVAENNMLFTKNINKYLQHFQTIILLKQ